MEIIASSVADAVRKVARSVLDNGEVVPRVVGQWTMHAENTTSNIREIHGLSVVVKDPMRRWTSLVNRGLVAETFDFLLGDNPGFIQDVWPFYRDWQTRGDRYPYVYGARIHGTDEQVDQWGQAVRTLRRDKTSRHACITIRRPQDIVEDYQPCSVAFQAQINAEGKLDFFYQMRSNDCGAPGGFARNLFMCMHVFEQLSLATGIPMGSYYHYATNMHIYEKDLKKAETMISEVQEYDLGEPSTALLFTPRQMSYTREIFIQALRANDFGNIDSERDLMSKLNDNPYYQNLVRFVIRSDERRINLNELLWLREFDR